MRRWLRASIVGVLAAVAIVPARVGASTTLVFTATWESQVEAGLPTFTFGPGAGTSNVMGPITTAGEATITGLSLQCLAGLANTNTEVLTAADGTLTLTSVDVGCITGIGTFHGVGQYTVTGGTGRYAGATGNGTLDGRVNLLTSSGTFVASGSLTLP